MKITLERASSALDRGTRFRASEPSIVARSSASLTLRRTSARRYQTHGFDRLVAAFRSGWDVSRGRRRRVGSVPAFAEWRASRKRRNSVSDRETGVCRGRDVSRARYSDRPTSCRRRKLRVSVRRDASVRVKPRACCASVVKSLMAAAHRHQKQFQLCEPKSACRDDDIRSVTNDADRARRRRSRLFIVVR